MSVIVVWSEVLMYRTQPTLSVYALVLNAAGAEEAYFGLETLTFLTLLYLSVCTYRVVFKLRLFDYYYLVPHKQTDAARCVACGLARGLGGRAPFFLSRC